MNAPRIIPSHELSTSVNKESSSAKPERFREYYDMKVEKTEEREEKRRSIFEMIADENPLAAPIPLSICSSYGCISPSSVTSISKEQSDWIASETNSAIMHCIKNGIKETSLRLDGKAFIGSRLQGMELIVKEFSTAPLVFNIEFHGSPTAIAFLQPHLVALSAALHSEKKGDYSIHRIEAELENSSPFLFHRKPSPEGSSDQPGG